MLETILVLAIRDAVCQELAQRRTGEGYSQDWDGPAALYGATGAVNIRAVPGIPLEVPISSLARWIIAYQREDGRFSESGSRSDSLSRNASSNRGSVFRSTEFSINPLPEDSCTIARPSHSPSMHHG